MLVPVTLLLVFTYIPFGEMVGFSFYDMKYIGSREFVGLKNYKEVFTRDDCFRALTVSLYYIGASFIQLAIALYFASVLSFKTKCSGLFKGLMFFPYLLCVLSLNSFIQGVLYLILYCSGVVLTRTPCHTGLKIQVLITFL